MKGPVWGDLSGIVSLEGETGEGFEPYLTGSNFVLQCERAISKLLHKGAVQTF